MRKNGEWGQLKSFPDYCKLENLRDPKDQRIMALLLGSQDATSYYPDLADSAVSLVKTPVISRPGCQRSSLQELFWHLAVSRHTGPRLIG
jgi:hypothetical protein